MTDVRLTATNPDDSSVVPVACNSRGELLITEPVIENIPNDLRVDGVVISMDRADRNGFASGASWLGISNSNGQELVGGVTSMTGNGVNISSNGYRYSDNLGTSLEYAGSTSAAKIDVEGQIGKIVFRTATDWPSGSSFAIPARFTIDESGGRMSNLMLCPDGMEKAGGREINVAEELQFLRSQVQAMAEKLRMTPEGGWPVWDGTDA